MSLIGTNIEYVYKWQTHCNFSSPIHKCQIWFMRVS